MTHLLLPPNLLGSDSTDHFASFDVAVWQWVAFVVLISVLLIGDLVIFHSDAHEPTFKQAAVESAIWITIGVSFTVVVFLWHGGQASQEYISGYLIEKSLSIDNVFVWA